MPHADKTRELQIVSVFHVGIPQTQGVVLLLAMVFRLAHGYSQRRHTRSSNPQLEWGRICGHDNVHR